MIPVRRTKHAPRIDPQVRHLSPAEDCPDFDCCTKARIVQSDAAPPWQANPLFLVARSSALLSLFAVPRRMSFLVCLLCFLFHTLYPLLCSLRSPLFRSLRATRRSLRASFPSTLRSSFYALQLFALCSGAVRSNALPQRQSGGAVE